MYMHTWKLSCLEREPSPAERALALNIVSDLDLLRLKAIARMHARRLPPDVNWSDLLQETFARVLSGRRRIPEGVNRVAFLAGVMRSIRAELWRRAYLEGVSYARHLARLPREAASPERVLAALQELAEIQQLFAGDAEVLDLIEGLGEGLSADEIRGRYGLSQADYDAARKRMRRALLRKGLACITN
jgi:RNA polymerase sigma-70 factor (ECF subfamily)